MADNFNTGGLFGSGIYAYADGHFPTIQTGRPIYRATRLTQGIIAGGVAGNHTLAGIGPEDKMVAVTRYVGAGVAVTDVTDLTSEFTITAINTINNTGGTNTTGDKLQIWWLDRPLP